MFKKLLDRFKKKPKEETFKIKNLYVGEIVLLVDKQYGGTYPLSYVNYEYKLVKKGVFYGFWEMINEVSEEELIKYDELSSSTLQEVSFIHKNNYSSFFGRGWLYKIQLNDKHIFFMAHQKSIHFGGDNDNSTVSGIVYPSDDKGLFAKS